eukprot:TRINITY_DN1310_c0_g1_i1.p1 TRINITY_DN1310_c0_g1~~TRINITY_DN1310_c0_g1_i1.p1  ORF type:complete len:222 (+),score=114.51 TRINITY_DN1310_c0_g1_i1:46-711(+)
MSSEEIVEAVTAEEIVEETPENVSVAEEEPKEEEKEVEEEEKEEEEEREEKEEKEEEVEEEIEDVKEEEFASTPKRRRLRSSQVPEEESDYESEAEEEEEEEEVPKPKEELKLEFSPEKLRFCAYPRRNYVVQVHEVDEDGVHTVEFLGYKREKWGYVYEKSLQPFTVAKYNELMAKNLLPSSKGLEMVLAVFNILNEKVTPPNVGPKTKRGKRGKKGNRK